MRHDAEPTAFCEPIQVYQYIDAVCSYCSGSIGVIHLRQRLDDDSAGDVVTPPRRLVRQRVAYHLDVGNTWHAVGWYTL